MEGEVGSYSLLSLALFFSNYKKSYITSISSPSIV
jgi:hypothetical protein